MSVYQVATGVTRMLAVATSLDRISASVIKASMEMDTLVLVGKVCECFPAWNIWLSLYSCLGLFLFTDIDECIVNNGHCEHNCTNEPGRYSCQCASGYQLDQDGHNCTGNRNITDQWPSIHFIWLLVRKKISSHPKMSVYCFCITSFIMSFQIPCAFMWKKRS